MDKVLGIKEKEVWKSSKKGFVRILVLNSLGAFSIKDIKTVPVVSLEWLEDVCIEESFGERERSDYRLVIRIDNLLSSARKQAEPKAKKVEKQE